ncbi:hypothetical protein V1515DRAFT_578430 [Lipomyces mesembrius]
MPKLNWDGRVDVSLDDPCRLYVLDAPMGAGKTHTCITFRQSLAKVSPRRTCANATSMMTFGRRDRTIAVALDNVDMPYDLVLIDECVFVEFHFLFGTMGANLPRVMNSFQSFLRSSRKVVAMQHRIPESTVSFYMEPMSLAWGVDRVIRRKLVSLVVLHPMKVVTSYNGSNLLACKLVSPYMQSFDSMLGRSSMPIVV